MAALVSPPQMQAAERDPWFAAPLMPASRMLVFLGAECRTLRENAGIKAIHVAARLDSSEAKVTRFEKGQTQPDDLDGMVTAFADELGVQPTVIWQGALKTWLAAPEEIPVLPAATDGAGPTAARAPKLRRPPSTPEVKRGRRSRRTGS